MGYVHPLVFRCSPHVTALNIANLLKDIDGDPDLAEIELHLCPQLLLSGLGFLVGWTLFVESVLVLDSVVMFKIMICFMRLAYENNEEEENVED